jgi:hypothetical protein
LEWENAELDENALLGLFFPLLRRAALEEECILTDDEECLDEIGGWAQSTSSASFGSCSCKASSDGICFLMTGTGGLGERKLLQQAERT